MRALRLFTTILAVVALVGVALPATAHDPDDGHDHAGPGSEGPDAHSDNVKLVSNVPASAEGVTQSDLAFQGNLAIAGNFAGFRIIDIRSQARPRVISDVLCNGGQGDVSVYGNLVFRSVDTPQSSTDCDSQNVTASTPGHFEGIQVFDISDPADPVHINSIYTDCGSHTHTLVPDGERLFIYVSSYPLGGVGTGPNCRSLEQDPDDGGHNKISIIEVDLDDPSWTGNTSVSAYHLDEDTAWATYLGAFTFRACHDISVFIELGLAAAACLSESQLWDISDPADPQFLWRYDNPFVQPENIDLWHSASFSWDGTIVAFGDESGGGGAARCIDPDDGQGRIWFLDTETGEELGSYKIPRSEPGVCTMHNFNFIPTHLGNVLVSSAYTGGTTIVDVDALLAGASEAEAEVGYYKPSGGSAWSSYWYNGRIYANDIVRGVDTFLLTDRARAGARKLPLLNPQTQMDVIR